MPRRASDHNFELPLGLRPGVTPVPRRDGLPTGFALVALARLVTNISFRLVFPFLPRIAGGLGVSLGTMGTALAVRDLAGMASPSLGRAADRRGHAPAMAAGLAGVAVGLVLQAVSSGLVLFTAALIIITLAKSLFDVGSSAWVGDAVPFRSRGRAIGTLEMSWAVAFIVGMPLAALLIRITTWRTPFLVAAIGCVLMAFAVGGSLPRPVRSGHVVVRVTWTRPIIGGVAAMLFIGVGHELLLVTFATWLEDTHGISVSGLGLTAVVIGFAELAGSGGTAVLSDRLGTVRSVQVALLAAVPASLLINVGEGGLGLALASMAVYFVVVEYSIVAMLSLFSELDRRARGAVIGLALAGFTFGHAVGAIAGTQAYERWGMPATSMAMAAAFAVAAALVIAAVDEPAGDPADAASGGGPP